jgi:hypothetical protein
LLLVILKIKKVRLNGAFQNTRIFYKSDFCLSGNPVSIFFYLLFSLATIVEGQSPASTTNGSGNISAGPPEITEQPIDQTDCQYNTVVFSAGFTSAGSVIYQWESNDGSGWIAYGTQGNTNTSPIKLTVANIGANGINLNGTQYRVTISDNNGIATSLPATLTVNNLSGILPGNTHTILCAGQNFSFTAGTTGSIPVSFQWLKNNNPISDGSINGVIISGSNTPALTVTNASTLESGSYQVRIVFNVIDGISVGKTCQITSQLVRNVTVNPSPEPNSIINE